MSASTMRAVRYHAYGPPENLIVETVPIPSPQEGEALVRVYSAGVNPIDWLIRQGTMQERMPVTFPAIPGFDLAGIVEAVGPGVTNIARGDAVYGRGKGTYADYCLAPAGELAPKPRTITFDEAASVPTGATVAWLGIFELADLLPGERILIHGAAGGVGLFAVQFARWKGAFVAGTASAANVEFVQSLGADMVIDYRTTAFEDVVHDMDVVFDTVGGATRERSWQVLKPDGILVTTVGPKPDEEAKHHGRRAATVSLRKMPTERLHKFAELIDSGAVKPVVNTIYSLDEAGKAHIQSETGHGRGRIVLHIAD
jgi:NADPH:quinone reductase-like Zn-dependent oxidoreductase